ncbi:hypothetical protein GGI04_004702 [Coemansia thaxteri]|nr:hypothetical protein GGI04_004702 [Coemansia thaxteri]
MTKSGAKSKEAQLYRPISAFVDYVAYWVDAELSTALASDTGLGRSRNEFRLIRPTTKTDYKPDDPDNGTKIDIGLCSTAVGNPTDAVGRAMFSRLMAVVEVKLSSGGSSVNDSFAQLYEYTRQVYAEQFDLRFAWGVTVCATKMRVCHFGLDLALSSCAMDEATPKGRQDFIKLLVNWSLCEAAQLGRDPTISRVPGMNWWQIECPDDPNNGASEDGGCGSSYKPVKTYYFSRVICGADHLFGRYTRCLAATDIEPSEEAEAAGELKPRFVVKDAWPVADQDTTKHSCDEVLLLKRIKKALSVSSSEDLVYSQIAVGGRVNMTVDNALVEDNTDNLYKGVDIPSNIKVPRRAHRRIVTSPIGEPLHEVESVRELILVVGDIMHCHSAISTECSIFYRDISDNNILIVRREGEPTRGLLIDFDCALDLSKERTGMRGEMTGTFPSMSNKESNIISSQSHRPAFRKCNNTHTNDEHVG